MIKKKIIVITIIFIVCVLGMFFVIKDNNFNSDGTTNKCFAFTPQGMEEVSCAYKVHPIYGTAVQPMTEAIILIQTKSDKLQQIKAIYPNKNSCFFSPDGIPLVWYHERDNGQIDFFDHPGYHPQLGVILNPVNKDIMMKFFSKKNDEKNDKNGLEDLRDFLQKMQQ